MQRRWKQMGCGPGAVGARAMTPPSGGASVRVVDFKQYFHIIVKRIWLVALCFVIRFVVRVILVRAGALFLFEGHHPALPRLQFGRQDSPSGGEDIWRLYATQKRIIESRSSFGPRSAWICRRMKINAKLMGYSVYPFTRRVFFNQLLWRVIRFSARFRECALAEEYWTSRPRRGWTLSSNRDQF
jgi:hypothetical protein